MTIPDQHTIATAADKPGNIAGMPLHHGPNGEVYATGALLDGSTQQHISRATGSTVWPALRLAAKQADVSVEDYLRYLLKLGAADTARREAEAAILEGKA